MMIRAFNSRNEMPICVMVSNVPNAIEFMKMEIHDFGNPFGIVRFDLSDRSGLILRTNVLAL